jgi:uncharacterized protein involved in high-affinity Fe2+ transport
MQRLGSTLVCAAGVIAAGCSAAAKEYPIGAPQEKNGMEIGAVYLQPIEMDPPGVMRPAKDSDLHLESDIKAAKDNKNGFAQGDWIPYLAVDYELTKLDGNETRKGEFMAMVANDGPHYGDNVKMMGPGKYRLTLTIAPRAKISRPISAAMSIRKPAWLRGSRLSPSNMSSPMRELEKRAPIERRDGGWLLA